jgi:hypothetical protein
MMEMYKGQEEKSHVLYILTLDAGERPILCCYALKYILVCCMIG